MNARWANVVVAALCLGGVATPQAMALVDLELRSHPQSIAIGVSAEIELYAVSSDETEFTSMDVILVWDPSVLKYVGLTPHHSWAMSGLLSDELLDGLNNTWEDGDALYQGVSFTPAAATSEGLLIATFRFVALIDAPSTAVLIVPSRGESSETVVFGAGQVNLPVTGELREASLTVESLASLRALDLTVPAGRVADLIVSGDINGTDAFGVTIMAEISPQSGALGMLQFTPAPPNDVVQLGDAWLGEGLFTVFDSEPRPGTGSPFLNGSIDSNASVLTGEVFYSGPLTAFPVIASEDARGTWDIRLCTGRCTVADTFSWWDSVDPVPTALYHAVIRVVELGDGDGGETIDAHDFSEMQACFTGSVGPVFPSAYEVGPASRCNVYDFNDDGDVDIDDFTAFRQVISGPGL